MSDELPRLSRALRAKTDLEIKRNIKISKDEQINLNLWRAKESKRGISWKELKTFIMNNTDETTALKINNHLNKLRNLTRDLIGTEEDGNLIDDATIFILNLFLDVKIVMMKHLAQMKKIFGTISPQTANKLCLTVNEISPLLNDECRKFLEKISTSVSTEITNENSINDNNNEIHWGSQIICLLPNFDECIASTSTSLNDNKNELIKLQDLSPNLSGKAKTALTFSMKYDKKDEPSTSSSSSSKLEEENKKYTKSWLAKHINPIVINNLIELLKSKKTNDELQNDLFELLGFDKFEIIQEIFQHRKEIVEKVEASDKNNN